MVLNELSLGDVHSPDDAGHEIELGNVEQKLGFLVLDYWLQFSPLSEKVLEELLDCGLILLESQFPHVVLDCLLIAFLQNLVHFLTDPDFVLYVQLFRLHLQRLNSEPMVIFFRMNQKHVLLSLSLIRLKSLYDFRIVIPMELHFFFSQRNREVACKLVPQVEEQHSVPVSSPSLGLLFFLLLLIKSAEQAQLPGIIDIKSLDESLFLITFVEVEEFFLHGFILQGDIQLSPEVNHFFLFHHLLLVFLQLSIQFCLPGLLQIHLFFAHILFSLEQVLQFIFYAILIIDPLHHLPVDEGQFMVLRQGHTGSHCLSPQVHGDLTQQFANEGVLIELNFELASGPRQKHLNGFIEVAFVDESECFALAHELVVYEELEEHLHMLEKPFLQKLLF